MWRNDAVYLWMSEVTLDTVAPPRETEALILLAG
jgi:hypothetical protein